MDKKALTIQVPPDVLAKIDNIVEKNKPYANRHKVCLEALCVGLSALEEK